MVLLTEVLNNMQIFLAIASFVFGNLIGSFLNVVILRLPQEQSLTGRSHCMHCRHVLQPWELIPVVSFLLLRGKCSSCGKGISPRYFIIELITGFLFLAGFLLLQPITPFDIVRLIGWWFVSAIAISVFVIDLEHYIILDVLVLPGAIIALCFRLVLDILFHVPVTFFHSLAVTGILGALLGSLPFFLVWFFSKGKWMGFGDVKLLLFMGAVLGWHLVGVAILLAVFAGGLVSSVLLFATDKTLKSQIPFGTFLSAALLVTLGFGDQILHWYLSLLGI